MANFALLCSSCGMVLLHAAAVAAFGGPLLLRCSYLGGPATSVWNHGTTSCLAQLADRAAMAVGCALDVCYMATLPLPQAALLSLGNGAAVAAYCLAQRQATRRVATAWHLASHACVSASHGAMLYFLGLRARPARAPSAHAQRTRPAHIPAEAAPPPPAAMIAGSLVHDVLACVECVRAWQACHPAHAELATELDVRLCELMQRMLTGGLTGQLFASPPHPTEAQMEASLAAQTVL